MNRMLCCTMAGVMLAFTCQTSADMVAVPGGEFQMGCSSGDDACDKDGGPQGTLCAAAPGTRTAPTCVVHSATSNHPSVVMVFMVQSDFGVQIIRL